MKQRFFVFLLLICVLQLPAQLKWPAVNNTMKPWTRWWWHGSAVNKQGLSQQLLAFQKAGLGGVEITPIYGARGYDPMFLEFLSAPWMNMLTHTLKEAEKLGLGVDMANGTGWPFGGPWVNDEHASKTLYHKVFNLKEGERLKEPITFLNPGFVRTANNTTLSQAQIDTPLQLNKNLQQLSIDQVQFSASLKPFCVIAYGPDSNTRDITNKLNDQGVLDWQPPAGDWKIIALFSTLHGKMVERAAPGGEGYAIDHFSAAATREYLAHFDKKFKGYDLSYLRGFFNDSYEVDDARGQSNWTATFLEEFRKRRGYDLTHHLPSLLEPNTTERSNRVLYDYRSVIDELLLEHFTEYWKQWADGKKKVVRNQSHGSPANTLDLYSVVDIPETEGDDILRFKFASSAGNVSGKKLVSAEAATWLDEHFLSDWARVRKAVDLFFLGGVNHIVYHGTAYSPATAAWPGWLFYAAVHFQPTNPMWRHFHALNQYVTRVQSFLQTTKPDNDILVYYPIADQYAKNGGPLLQHFDGMHRNFENSLFEKISLWMTDNDYSFDFFSSRQLQRFRFDGKINTGAAGYQTILLPANNFITLEDFNQLITLARDGASILFFQNLPTEVPGFFQHKEQQAKLDSMIQMLKFENNGSVSVAKLGKGKFLMSADLNALLQSAAVTREQLQTKGLSFIRKVNDQGKVYFISNTSGKVFNDWISLETEADISTVGYFDPMHGKTGLLAVRKNSGNKREYLLHLQPGESSILQTYTTPLQAKSLPYYSAAGNPVEIGGKWNVTFIEGGPMLPAAYSSDGPLLWTATIDTNAASFSGVARYQTSFTKPTEKALYWKLDLGEVHETASIELNGKRLATLIGPSFSVIVPASELKENNSLVVQVANNMANRIIYMDRNQLPWKYYYNINMSAKKKENLKNGLFDASAWKPLPSGVKGPVTLIPIKTESY